LLFSDIVPAQSVFFSWAFLEFFPILSRKSPSVFPILQWLVADQKFPLQGLRGIATAAELSGGDLGETMGKPWENHGKGHHFISCNVGKTMP
jgi:hypothetical protein